MGRVSAQLFTDNVSKDRPGNFLDFLLYTKLKDFFSLLTATKHIQLAESSFVVVLQLAYLFLLVVECIY